MKTLPPTLYKRNAGENAKSKFRLSIPPKLRFDVLKKEDKTQSVSLANVRAKRKSFGSETPHYAYTGPLVASIADDSANTRHMNILQKIARQIIKKSFNFSVWTIEQFHDKNYYADQVENLRKYPIGTLGHDIAKCLDDNKLGLVPKYESHDLKHVLLDFKMTPVDEIRMQAFMLGNGNYTIPCFAILTFGVILLPDEWSTFYKDFKCGQKSKPISSWTIENYADFQTQTLRKQVIETRTENQKTLTMKTITKYGALASIIAGIFGMLFCLPFLFSSNIADLVGAGFPFVGGAILTVGGLFTLSNLTRQTPKYA